MKVLVFAHVPPPHHGQSYMVQLLLAGLASRGDLECVHVNARLSTDLEDVGRFRLGKLTGVMGYCLQAIGARIRTGARVLY